MVDKGHRNVLKELNKQIKETKAPLVELKQRKLELKSMKKLHKAWDKKVLKDLCCGVATMPPLYLTPGPAGAA